MSAEAGLPKVLGLEVVGDSASAHAQFIGDFLGRKAFVVEAEELLGFTEEHILLRFHFGACGPAEGGTFLPHSIDDVVASEGLHLPLQFNNIVDRVNKEVHCAAGLHRTSVKGDDGALIVLNVIHHRLKHREAAPETAHFGNDDCVAVTDWAQQVSDSLVGNAAHSEVVLDEAVLPHPVRLTPRQKRIALLPECCGVGMDGEVEVVHNILLHFSASLVPKRGSFRFQLPRIDAFPCNPGNFRPFLPGGRSTYSVLDNGTDIRPFGIKRPGRSLTFVYSLSLAEIIRAEGLAPGRPRRMGVIRILVQEM